MKITYHTLDKLAKASAQAIKSHLQDGPYQVYPVPRGGVGAALALGKHLPIILTDDPFSADFMFDDLIDSGETMSSLCAQNPGKPFFALIDKRSHPLYKNKWIIFPWEETAEASIEDNIRRVLQYVGEDPKRGGLLETPNRVAKAWSFWCSGYNKDPASVLKTFQDGAEGAEEMVVVKDIPFYTHCEHHMAPFFGTATIAYLPNKRIIGLSKVNRLLDIFARRLQVQERLTAQVADALMDNLQPLGCGVLIKARHLCMESRGVCQQGHHTVTSALRGLFKEDPAVRSEFLELARNGKEP